MLLPLSFRKGCRLHFRSPRSYLPYHAGSLYSDSSALTLAVLYDPFASQPSPVWFIKSRQQLDTSRRLASASLLPISAVVYMSATLILELDKHS